MQTYERDLDVIFQMYEDLLDNRQTKYDAASKTVVAEYVTLSYDLIDKDLDYDEIHHKHLLSGLEESINIVCKHLITQDDCAGIVVSYKHMIQRDRVVDVKQLVYGKNDRYFTSGVTNFTPRTV